MTQEETLCPVETDEDYIAEFRSNPLGPHGPGLQRLLNVLRSSPAARQFAIVTLVPFQQWAIARLPEDRSGRITIERDAMFTSLAAAEWALFSRLWDLRPGKYEA